MSTEMIKYQCNDCEKERAGTPPCVLTVRENAGKPKMCAVSFLGMKCEWIKVED